MHLIYLLGLLVPCPPSRRKPGACSRWVEMLQLLPVRGASEPAPLLPKTPPPTVLACGQCPQTPPVRVGSLGCIRINDVFCEADQLKGG